MNCNRRTVRQCGPRSTLIEAVNNTNNTTFLHFTLLHFIEPSIFDWTNIDYSSERPKRATNYALWWHRQYRPLAAKKSGSKVYRVIADTAVLRGAVQGGVTVFCILHFTFFLRTPKNKKPRNTCRANLVGTCRLTYTCWAVWSTARPLSRRLRSPCDTAWTDSLRRRTRSWTSTTCWRDVSRCCSRWPWPYARQMRPSPSCNSGPNVKYSGWVLCMTYFQLTFRQISGSTHQLPFIRLHCFKLERFKST